MVPHGLKTITNGEAAITLRGDLNGMFAELYSGLSFRKTVRISAAGAATPVTILTDGEVDTGRNVFITSILLHVNGSTAWEDNTATGLTIRDTNGTPIEAATFAKALLTGDATLTHASSGVAADAVLLGAGFTIGKGLVIVGDASFASGSDVYVTVCGTIIASVM